MHISSLLCILSGLALSLSLMNHHHYSNENPHTFQQTTVALSEYAGSVSGVAASMGVTARHSEGEGPNRDRPKSPSGISHWTRAQGPSETRRRSRSRCVRRRRHSHRHDAAQDRLGPAPTWWRRWRGRGLAYRESI